MKKTFTSLLALAGMVVGFTLCSCGGGGGGNDEIVNLDGLEITSLTSTETSMQFTKASANYYALQLSFGGSNSDGHFLVKGFTPGSQPRVVGAISLTANSDVRAAANWLGLPPDSNLTFSIPDEIELTMTFGSKTSGTGSMTRKGKVLIWSGNPLIPSKSIDLATGEIRGVDAEGNEGDVIDGGTPEIEVDLETSFHYENASGMLKK
ncbi:MAG: hypothetical protein J6J97_04285 [Akkermansia sp.]|nr:hypothetical protein [Akkermansia sp.]